MKTKTTVLLEAEETDKATKKTAAFRLVIRLRKLGQRTKKSLSFDGK